MPQLLSTLRKKRNVRVPDIDYYVIDSSAHSDKYFNIDVPTTFTSGRNLIKINPINFKSGTSILIEILDSTGNSIYIENTNFKYDNKIVIPVYIYPETPIGDSTIKIVGIASYDYISDSTIPTEYSNDYNVIWTSNVYVNPLEINSTELIFDSYPSIAINKKFGTYNDISYVDNTRERIVSGSNITYSFSGQRYYSNLSEYARNLLTSDVSTLSSIGTDIQTNNYDDKRSLEPFVQNKIEIIDTQYKFYVSKNKIEYPILTLSSPLQSGSMLFHRDMLGASVELTDIEQVQSIEFKSNDDIDYTATIIDIIDETHCKVNVPYTRKTIDNNSKYVYKSFNDNNINVTFEYEPILNDSEYYTNFAEIEFKNVIPLSGYVDKARIYIRSKSDKTDYRLINEVKFASQNLYVDDLANKPNYPIGEFISQDHIDSYWNITGSYTLTDEVLLNSINFNNTVTTLNSTKGVQIYNEHNYQLSFNVIGNTVLSTDKLDIYMITSTDDIKLATINLSKNINYRNIIFDFKSTVDDIINFRFEFNGGIWNISDIRLKPRSEFGYNPEYLRLKIPINPLWVNDEIDFKFQFISTTGQESRNNIEMKNVKFEEYTPTYIGGSYNLITGSLFVGDGLQTGFEISGQVGSMFRSIGYSGWDAAETGDSSVSGLMLWSGSVAPNGITDDLYAGVGIELHDGAYGSFRFRTQTDENNNGSIFEVKTDSFFFGREDTQFISGSNGVLHISSSYFELTPSGTIIATSGSIGGWEINSDKLSKTTYDGIYLRNGIELNSGLKALILQSSEIESSELRFEHRVSGSAAMNIIGNQYVDFHDKYIWNSGSPYTYQNPTIEHKVGNSVNSGMIIGTDTRFTSYDPSVGTRTSSDFIIDGYRIVNLLDIQTLNINWKNQGGYDVASTETLVKIDLSSTGVTNNYALWSRAQGGTNNWAGWFDGNTMIDGKFHVTSTGVPTTAIDPGITGQIVWDSGYVYVCIATDTWKRATISTW